LRLKTVYSDCTLLTSFIIGYGDDELDGHGRWEDGGGRGGDGRMVMADTGGKRQVGIGGERQVVGGEAGVDDRWR